MIPNAVNAYNRDRQGLNGGGGGSAGSEVAQYPIPNTKITFDVSVHYECFSGGDDDNDG